MFYPASIIYKSRADRYRPVSYPDGPITDRYRFIKNAYWVVNTFSTKMQNGVTFYVLHTITLRQLLWLQDTDSLGFFNKRCPIFSI